MNFVVLKVFWDDSIYKVKISLGDWIFDSFMFLDDIFYRNDYTYLNFTPGWSKFARFDAKFTKINWFLTKKP